MKYFTLGEDYSRFRYTCYDHCTSGSNLWGNTGGYGDLREDSMKYTKGSDTQSDPFDQFLIQLLWVSSAIENLELTKIISIMSEKHDSTLYFVIGASPGCPE